jgi:hypothetical protein
MDPSSTNGVVTGTGPILVEESLFGLVFRQKEMLILQQQLSFIVLGIKGTLARAISNFWEGLGERKE